MNKKDIQRLCDEFYEAGRRGEMKPRIIIMENNKGDGDTIFIIQPSFAKDATDV
jgi:hypothetical protein